MCVMDGGSDRANSSLATILDKGACMFDVSCPSMEWIYTVGGGSGVVRIYFRCVQAWARYISSIKCFHHMIIMMHKLCFHHIGVQLVPTSRAWEWAEMQHLSSFAKNRSSEAKLRNQWNISAIGCFDPFVCCVEEPAEAELEAARLGWC